MTTFMNEDFLLQTEAARQLYHDYAEKLPLIDYHCHLNPREIYEDIRFENLETKVFRVTNIIPQNVPAGMDAKINTTEVNVKVRGPKEQISLLTDEMLSVRVDFTNATLAVMEPFRADVYVNADYGEVGVVGSYMVWATLTQSSGETG